MENIDIIQDSIDYIEENLKEELSAELLAQRAGFSVFYYYHIFQNFVGLAVSQYIQKRRMLHAVYEIGLGKSISNVEAEYGFESHSGFYKAFKREFSMSPKEYLTIHKPKKPYKINLKQEEHFMITHKKIKEILNNWDVIKPVTICDIYYSNGERAENSWRVNDKFIIKSGKDIEGLKMHINISQMLKESGLLASCPVKTKTEEDYYIENNRYFCLMKPIEGDMMKSSEIICSKDYKEKSRYIGEIIGQLHKVIKNYEDKIEYKCPNLFENVCEYAMPIVRDTLEIPYKFYDDYKNNFGELYKNLPKQLIHRDINPSNIIYDGLNSGFIDFDLCEKNIRIYDPCYAATAILSESFNEKDYRDKWFDIFENIVVGYDSVCRLSKDERKSLPYVVLSNQIICYAYFSQLDKYEELKLINKDMTLWLYRNIKQLDVFSVCNF